MAWQEIYGEMQDDCGRTIEHTSSRRGIVKSIAFHIKSNSIGNPIDLDVIAADKEKSIWIGEIERKIQEWKNKESHIKNKDNMIKYWENKLKMAEEQNAEIKKKNKVKILLNFPAINDKNIMDKELLVLFEGTELDVSDLKNLRNNPVKFRELLEDLKRNN